VCVLIVDDEPIIRAVLAETFADAGYAVAEAENGDSAAALIDGGEIEFTLLVTDITMAGRDGIELARLMRRRNPEVPVIYITGRPDAMDRVDRGNASVALVAKPFLPSDLVRVAKELLAGRAQEGH
jgi:DNA-binding response OmpR family regulator